MTPVQTPERDAIAASPGAQPTDPPAAPAHGVREPADLVEAELLVEDVSIDGMCGVY